MRGLCVGGPVDGWMKDAPAAHLVIRSFDDKGSIVEDTYEPEKLSSENKHWNFWRHESLTRDQMFDKIYEAYNGQRS